MENEDSDLLMKPTQDHTSPKSTVDPRQGDEAQSADVSMEVDTNADKAEDLMITSPESVSPNMSASSDLVSGTPQKPSSRRQSFITLEKYAEGKSASPSSASTFTGPLAKTSSSQGRSQPPAHPDSQSSPKEPMDSQHPVNDTTESPRRPKDSGMKSEPVRLIERLSSDTAEDEDVIPDTQTKAENQGSTEQASASEMNPSQEEESDAALDDSQSSLVQSPPSEPRRSGRHRVRPLLPGEDPQDWMKTYKRFQRTHSGSGPIASGPHTRSKQAAEEDSGRQRLRSRDRAGERSRTPAESKAPKKLKLHKSLETSCDKPQSKRRSNRESSQTDMSDSQSDYESQSQGRRGGRLSKSPAEIQEDVGPKKVVSPESSQSSTQEDEKDDVLKINTPSPQSNEKSQEVELVEQVEPDNEVKASQITTTSPPNARKPQEVELVEEMDKDDLQLKSDSQNLQNSDLVKSESKDSPSVTLPQNKEESQDRTSQTYEPKTTAMEERLSQEDSQDITPSSQSQSLRRSRRSKASPEAESLEKQSGSNSQTPVTASDQTETRSGGRTRRSKVQEPMSKPSPSSESSQSQDAAGSESSLGRYSTRRSLASVDTSESDSSPTTAPRRRGNKPRASLQSPLTLESTAKANVEAAKDEADDSQKADEQSFQTTNADLGGSQKSPERRDSETLVVGGDSEEQGSGEPAMELEPDAVAVAPEQTETCDAREHVTQQRDEDTDDASSPEGGDSPGLVESAGISSEPSDAAVASETPQKLCETSEEEAEDSSEPGARVDAEGNQNEDRDQQEAADVAQNQDESLNVIDAEDESASDEPSSAPQEQDQDDGTQTLEDQEQAKAEPGATDLASDSTHTVDFQDSPMKLKDLEAVLVPDAGQSPVSSRTRGTWSPSASPSTSILKKGQKRQLEEESPSPLVKVRHSSVCGAFCDTDED